MQADFIGTMAVQDKHRFDVDRLALYMQAHVRDFKGPLSVEQFKGGQSNPTFLLRTPEQSYVLRRKPPGKLLPSAHAVDREYRVTSALYTAGIPVARTFALCETKPSSARRSTSWITSKAACCGIKHCRECSRPSAPRFTTR